MKELLMFMMMALVLSAVMSMASYMVAIRSPTGEKVSAYECGFDPFVDSSQKFEVSFFLVGMLFMMFDLEMSMLFPWVQVLTQTNYWMVMTFLFMLTIGLVYEWKKGALEWE